MDRYSVIVVSDETTPVRRFEVAKTAIRRAAWGLGAAALLFTLCSVDYVRVRVAHGELDDLRVRVREQQVRIDAFDAAIGDVEGRLERIGEFERKVRIIANLPGSAASGGGEVTEMVRDDGSLQPGTAESGIDQIEPQDAALPMAIPTHEPTPTAARVDAVQRLANQLGSDAVARERSLAMLADELEARREKLGATPAIWPAKGWMTSRFGARTSPFTGRKQFHAGIDIAGERGTDVVASADGRVVFAGKRGPLGQSVILDHGHGIRTLYGHNDKVFVKRGETIERGHRIAALGNSGRSTGPHLHYVVELNGKAVNPLDYIFD
jgi:murein DD-endopeptidase MepM/ murein hydrolase activator NlpD